jgi:hypothetical protein
VLKGNTKGMGGKQSSLKNSRIVYYGNYVKFCLEQSNKTECFHGEMAEWSKAVASKAIIPRNWNRGFKSHSLLHFWFTNNKLEAVMLKIGFVSC